MNQLRFFVTAMTILIIVSCSTASNAVIIPPVVPPNVERYGDDAPKVWTALNEIEMQSLIRAKNNLDDEAKLLLSIFLTSDFRDPEPINACLNVYRKFVAKTDKELEKISGVREKGEKLHELFFKQFINKPRGKGSRSSGIPGVLLLKEYDVNTANFLFAIIAERYGFSSVFSFVEGDKTEIVSNQTKLKMSVITGKSYLSINHDELFSPIAVVPFLKNGYELFINMGFFGEIHESHPEFFEDAATELRRYYKKVDIPFEDALFLQYKIDKAEENINSIDAPIHRRVEMAALFTDSCEVLIDRVWGWRNMYPMLMKKDVPGKLIAFVDNIREEFERTEELCGNEARFVEAAWDLYLFSSFEFANFADGEKMKRNIKQAYYHLSPIAEDYGRKKLFLTRAVYQYINLTVQSGLIMRELENVKKIVDIIPENDKRTEMAASFYFQAGEYYLERNDMWMAGQFYADCAAQEHKKYQHQCLQKGLSSLYSYAQISIKNGRCALAADARDVCLNKMPNKDVCNLIVNLHSKNCR